MSEKGQRIPWEIETIYSDKFRNRIRGLINHFETQLSGVETVDEVSAIERFTRGKLGQITENTNWENKRKKDHDVHRADGLILDVLGRRISEINKGNVSENSTTA